MPFMPTQISLYEEMSALSARMVAAARAQDWDALVSLERSVAALRLALVNDDDNGGLSEPERESKTRLIQRILDDDAEVRRHTEPWMEQLRQFLGSAARKRQVERAYGAGR
ncbi:MAG TPA: flagellar protein FliT [Rhodocyclaceae bacterium]|nr:flagellar protein FliT [Rhodocyclaceae bacterium]